MSDVSCRVAWADDAPAMAALQVRAWRASYAGLLPAVALEALDADAMAAAWADALTRPPDARNRVLVALDHNRPVGYVVTGPASDPDLDPIAVGELGDLTVDPAERGSGHGSRLLQAAVDTLRADRFVRAVTWLASSHDPLRAFVAASGWQPDGAHRTLDLTGDGSVQVRQVRLHCDISA